jgi:hypothetical protein
MSVATYLGVANVDSPPLQEAVRSWPTWRQVEPRLSKVDHLLDLPTVLRSAPFVERDTTLATLAKIGTGDVVAVTALTWLLCPGASKVARRLADLSPDIDCLVAGQLWVNAATYDWRRPRRVAGAILSQTRRGVLAHLDKGDRARRRDRSWAYRVPLECLDHQISVGAEPSASQELAELLNDALDVGVVTADECHLLLHLTVTADRLAAPAGRGLAGLTAAAVAKQVSQHYGCSVSTIRHRAGAAIKKLRTAGGSAATDVKSA